MDSFLQFFETMPTWEKAAWVFICLVFCWVLESAFPLFHFQYNKRKHTRVNLVFLLCTMVINSIFAATTVGVFQWLEGAHFGLLYLVELPMWMELLIALLIFELVAQYIIHYLLHKVRWLWKFHMIHHSDTHVDVTSGTRHHPGDYVLRESFALAAVVVTGAPAAFYLFYRISTVFFTYFTHSNLDFPRWIDRPLSYVFVTPNMHKFHHHHKRPWTDTNYGNIFSIWDRLFGTFVYEDHRKIHYGLDILDDSTDEDIAYQFRIPFNRRVPSGRMVKDATRDVPLHEGR